MQKSDLGYLSPLPRKKIQTDSRVKKTDLKEIGQEQLNIGDFQLFEDDFYTKN